jgi:hypothetical protein
VGTDGLAVGSLIKKVPSWIYLLLLGAVTFYTWEIVIVPDMGWYMNSALNLVSGKGYTEMSGALIHIRAPLFPLFISGSYLCLGVSPWSAFWAIRLFAILNPLLIYFLGRKLFGKWIGFSAALLILSSYTVNYWSYRHLDAVWPFFAILSMLILYEAFEKKSYPYFFVSGILLGLSYLVKQAPIFLLGLPILLILATEKYRRRYFVVGTGIYVVTTIALISPWIIYVYFHTGNIKIALLGLGGEKAVTAMLEPNKRLFIYDYLKGLLAYYSGGSQSLANNFLIAPLFVFSWIYTLYRSFHGERESILLSATLLLFSPYLAHVGNRNLRAGQLIIFHLLSFLVTSKCCLEVCKKLVEFIKGKSHFSQRLGNYVFAVVIAGLIIVQTFVGHKRDKGNITFIRENYFYKLLVNRETARKMRGTFGEDSKQCGSWIRKHLPEDSRLLVSKPVEGEPIYFYSLAKYPIFVMPVIQSNIMPHGIAIKRNESIIFLSAWTAKTDPKNKLFLLTEDDLLTYIEEKKIDYIIVQKHRNYLSKYFDRNESFNKIVEFGNGAIKVYKVDNTRPIAKFNMMISRKLITYLKSLIDNNSDKFMWYVDNFFEPLLNWNNEKVKELLQLNNDNILKNAVVVKENKIYHSL